MSLSSSLQIGRSALTASQVAIQITGNNFANAATPGYSRQIVGLAPMRDGQSGSFFVGRGVYVQGVHRQIDSALQARMWAGVSQESASSMDLSLLSSVESTLNELSDSDLSSELSSFFNAWSELANSPGAAGSRSLIVQQGATLAGYMRNLRSDLGSLRTQVDRQLDATVSAADQLLTQIADLNESIVTAEGGSGEAMGLRDQRDSLITELSRFMDASTIEQPSGAIDVLIGSVPVVLGGHSRGIQLERQSGDDGIEVSISVRDDGQQLSIAMGSVGSLMSQRDTLVNDTVNRLDSLASQLIFQVNRIHSTGYSGTPMTSTAGTRAVPLADRSRALSDTANQTFSGLPFHAVTGGFNVTVKNNSTGATETVRIDVDLDGLDAAGAPGFGDDTSLDDIQGAMAGIANLTATLNPDGTLNLAATEGYSFSFSEDSSGALAVLGVNSYFTGTDASDINVRAALQAEPALLSTGCMVDGQPSDNGAALALAALQDQAIGALGGQSIRESWRTAVQSVAMRTDFANTRADATTLVRESLEAQRAAVSGVSVDEEAINLMNYQRQYQGAARFITVVDELTQTLLSMV
ncbi:MAG: flagellar hook-associated protein FlgK [Phycisphaerales bacterium]|nr:flagellar hook-associated protein FlgK [Phycisphaerales bacterium]